MGGDKNALNTLEKLENAEEQAQRDLTDLLERIQRCKERDAQLEQSVVDAANRLDSKCRQVEAVGKMIDTSAAQHKDDMTVIVTQAVSAAAEKAEEVQNIIGAWSDDPSKLEKNEVNTGLLDLVRKSQVLKDTSRYLGRFREIFAQGKRNGYAYARGEKYSLELGYQPNMFAKGLKEGRTYTIAFLIPDINSLSVEDDISHLVQFQKENNIPIVLVNRGAGETISSISIDDEHGGYLMTKALLEREERPTALFASMDILAIGAYQAFYEKGLLIP